jgi:hypothetical protein
MNDIQVIAQFRHLISKFKENQERLALAFVNGDFKNPEFKTIFINTNKLAIEIKEKLAHYNVLQIDDQTLRNELIAIRENTDFVFFEILKILSKYLDTGEEWTFAPEINQDKWWDMLQEEILSQIDPDMLIQRKMDLGALLVWKTVPEHLRNHLALIKECYTWGFENAASIYCRTVLEESFRYALKSKPEFRTPQGKQNLEIYRLSWLLNHSKQNKYFYKEVIDRAITITENVNKIVHPSIKEPRVKLSNIEIIKDTFYVMEMLFR